MPRLSRFAPLFLAGLLAVPVGSVRGQCLAADAPAAIAARDSLRMWFRLAPRWSDDRGFWSPYALPGGADDLVVVEDPARCRRAIIAITAERDRDLTTLRPVLIRAGHRYLMVPAEEFANGWPWLAEFDSTMTLLLPRDRLSSMNTGGSQDVLLPASESRCLGPEYGASRALLGVIQRVLTDPRQRWYSDLLGVTGTPLEAVRQVGAGPTCSLAIEAIQAHFRRPDRAVRMILFRVGAFHWAEVTYPSHGEWSYVFILDSAATRVIGQY